MLALDSVLSTRREAQKAVRELCGIRRQSFIGAASPQSKSLEASMHDLKVGSKVTLVQQRELRVKEAFTVGATESHNGLVFYRLREIEDGLFLRESLDAR
jgi:hypothetical protein